MDFSENTGNPQPLFQPISQPPPSQSIAKIFNFYYQGTCQKVKFYPGTSSDNILTLAFKLFNLDKLEPDLNILLKALRLVDAEGIPMVFDSNAIPSEENMYMVFNYNFKPTEEAPKPLPKRFKWDRTWNTRVCKSCYVINESGTEIVHGTEYEHSMAIAISDTPFKKGDGVHRFRVEFTKVTGYTFTGIVYGKELKPEANPATWGSGFDKVSSFHQTMSGSANFVIDMNSMTAKIGSKDVVLPDDDIYVGVSMKHKDSSAAVYFDD